MAWLVFISFVLCANNTAFKHFLSESKIHHKLITGNTSCDDDDDDRVVG